MIPFKAGSIANLTDARYFSAWGAAWIGFCFDPESPDYLSPEKALEIKGWLHGPRYLGEFGNQDADNVAGIAGFVGLDALEMPIDRIALSPETSHLPLFVRVSGQESDTELAGLPASVEGLIVDPQPLADPETALRRLTDRAPIWLDGLSHVDTVQHWLQRFPAAGWHLRGGAELATGLKLYDALDPVMELLEAWPQLPARS
jgi:phosphoribosylanthranilate isomerase